MSQWCAKLEVCEEKNRFGF